MLRFVAPIVLLVLSVVGFLYTMNGRLQNRVGELRATIEQGQHLQKVHRQAIQRLSGDVGECTAKFSRADAARESLAAQLGEAHATIGARQRARTHSLLGTPSCAELARMDLLGACPDLRERLRARP